MSRRRRKPVYRNWWVWLIVIVAVVIIYLFALGERIPEEEIQRDGAYIEFYNDYSFHEETDKVAAIVA